MEEFDLKIRFMEMEGNIVPTLTRYRRELAERLAPHAGERFGLVDLADVFDSEAEPAFIDDNHVCDRGYLLVAQALLEVTDASCVG